MSNKFDPQKFFKTAENVAAGLAAAELFGLLKRSFDLPAAWAALVTRETGDHIVVPAGAHVPGAGADEVLIVRVSPVDVALDEQNIITRDRYHCRAEVHVRTAVIPEPGELVSFRKAILGSEAIVRTEGLGRYLQPAVRTALAKLAAEHDAADLIGADLAETVSEALGEALKGPCFAAGLVLESAPTAKFESPTLRQVQQTEQEALRQRAEHEASRGLQEAREKAQTQHLDHLTSLLERLEAMASASPEVELPELLRTFSDHQRGELYEALFASDRPTVHTQWIVVAAGQEVLFFDPRNPDAPSRRSSIGGSVGGVRSVQTVRGPDGAHTLLLGGATGVYRLPVDAAEPDLTLCVPDAPVVRGGFNAAALVGGRVLASHSELGLREWSLDEPQAARSHLASITRNARAVRHILFADGYLYCSIDDRIIRWAADDLDDVPGNIYTGSAHTITSLCVTPDGPFAGNSAGDILHWSGRRDTEPERLHRGNKRAAESLWVLTTLGLRRIVFTDTSLGVHAQVVGDNFACRYEAGGQTLRRVEVAPDLVVATNDLRDRLFCWSPGEPGRPRAVIPVARLCGHSVQDVCLVGEV